MKIKATEHQLFIDDAVIESCNNLQRRYHTPQRVGIAIQPDKPWELNATIAFGSVLRDAETGRLRMWYTQFAGQRGIGRDILYAESVDGFHWEKPSIGLHAWNGSKDNNIVIPADHPAHPDGANVIYDPSDKDPSRRYKLSCCKTDRDRNNYGQWATFSPDGIHWGEWVGPVVPEYGDRNTLLLDPALRRPYVIFTRIPPQTMVEQYAKRIVTRLDSKDFLNWTQSDMILKPDLNDPLDVQFYSMVVCRYESLYLGFLQRLHSTEDVSDLELVSSRDSLHWQRNAQRVAFMESGFEQSIGSTWIGVSTNPPIEMNGQLLFFYEARSASHGLPALPFMPHGVIGVAALCKDRFAALSSGFVPGEVVTKPFLCPGGRLMLNLNARNHLGYTEMGLSPEGTTVEVLDESMSPVTGYTLNDCSPLRGEYRQGVGVQWKNHKDCDRLRGTKLRLRFRLVHSDLYAFWFEDEKRSGKHENPEKFVR